MARISNHLLGALLASLFILACASDDGARVGLSPKESGVCPDYQDITCFSRIICEMDKRRGCKVCYCEPPPGMGSGNEPQSSPALPE